MWEFLWPLLEIHLRCCSLLCSHLSLFVSPGLLEQIQEMKGKKDIFSYCYLRVLIITTSSKAKCSRKHREMKCRSSVEGVGADAGAVKQQLWANLKHQCCGYCSTDLNSSCQGNPSLEGKLNMPIKLFQCITLSDSCPRSATGFEAQSSFMLRNQGLTDWYCLEEFLLQLELNEKMVCPQTLHVGTNLSKSMSTESSIDFLLSLWTAKCFSSFQ